MPVTFNVTTYKVIYNTTAMMGRMCIPYDTTKMEEMK